MPRRYYRPRRTVVVRPKKKWATNISQFSYIISSSNPNPGKVLVQNTAQSSVPTPTVLKVGNFKIGLDVSFLYSSAPSNLPDCTVYVIFLPEGVSADTDAALGSLINAHPEWIMAWRRLDLDYAASSGAYSARSVTVSSRLKRNLNSGDKVLLGIYTNGSSATVSVRATVQFWTCAN